MARVVETEQKKKKNKLKIVLITLLVILLIAGGAFALWKFVFDKDEKVVQEIKEIDNVKDYGYTLMDKDSKYFKDEFSALKKIINGEEIDTKEYATQIAKMFTIDLYTMSTKVNKYDIGGVEYYHVNKKSMFEQKVMDTLYATILDNTFGDRKQELPEVIEVAVVSCKEGTFTLGETNVDSYVVELDITYVKDLGYDKKVSVVVVQENDSKRWSVVEVKPINAENKK